MEWTAEDERWMQLALDQVQGPVSILNLRHMGTLLGCHPCLS